MHDKPDHAGLYRLAEEQAGYFNAVQARSRGFSHALLAYHARPGGRFERVRRGLYRIRLFPSSPYEETIAAWIDVGPDVAVVSHESALELFDLSDVVSDAVHLTVPRERRWQRLPAGIRLHTTSRLTPEEISKWEGIRATSPERTLIDVTETGLEPDQLRLAVTQAMNRGLVSSESLGQAAKGRSRKTRDSILRAAAR
jgi:predicted transcriptional regulator of viral defense system